MSILNQPPTQSAECNANLPCNESFEAANDGSALSLAISDPTSLSLDLIDNRDNSSNDVFRNECLPNPGQEPCYNEEIVKGECSRDDNHCSLIGGNGYRNDQVHCYDTRANYYRGINGYRHNHMQFPRVQFQAYRPPFTYPPMRPVLFVSNAFNTNQGPQSYNYYVPSNVYGYSAQPQAQYHAAQQSNFSILLEDLRAKLRKQIEYYFCMENLCSDEYLRRHMDAQGWVPTSLIAGFRKVEQLMKEKQSLYDSFGLYNAATRVDDKQSSSNIQFITDSLRPSLSVEVQGDKVRNRHEWEKWLWPHNHSAD